MGCLLLSIPSGHSALFTPKGSHKEMTSTKTGRIKDGLKYGFSDSLSCPIMLFYWQVSGNLSSFQWIHRISARGAGAIAHRRGPACVCGLLTLLPGLHELPVGLGLAFSFRQCVKVIVYT